MIYTRKGDSGYTSLIEGCRVKKNDLRVGTYGTVDELNSHIGLLHEMLFDKSIDLDYTSSERKEFANCCSQLRLIQTDLFIIQSLLATNDAKTYACLPQLDPKASTTLETWIDKLSQRLPKSEGFVIPGGSVASAQAHIARTVCRRAERCMVTLKERKTKAKEGQTPMTVEKDLLKYINRLSDFLFIMARYVIVVENKKEFFWTAK